MTKMKKADERKFQPYTTRSSKLWTKFATIGNGELESGAVEMNDSIPVGAEVVGYAQPLEKGGFRIEWV